MCDCETYESLKRSVRLCVVTKCCFGGVLSFTWVGNPLHTNKFLVSYHVLIVLELGVPLGRVALLFQELISLAAVCFAVM